MFLLIRYVSEISKLNTWQGYKIAVVYFVNIILHHEMYGFFLMFIKSIVFIFMQSGLRPMARALRVSGSIC